MALEKPWRPRQFTGMFDITGVPIREGDIVCIRDLLDASNVKYIVVAWDDKRVGWNIGRWRGKKGKILTVVGNRYKNSNLAKKLAK